MQIQTNGIFYDQLVFFGFRLKKQFKTLNKNTLD
jgi:hypothetical protein